MRELFQEAETNFFGFSARVADRQREKGECKKANNFAATNAGKAGGTRTGNWCGTGLFNMLTDNAAGRNFLLFYERLEYGR
jgi:hypothetical protein